MEIDFSDMPVPKISDFKTPTEAIETALELRKTARACQLAASQLTIHDHIMMIGVEGRDGSLPIRDRNTLIIVSAILKGIGEEISTRAGMVERLVTFK